MSTIRTVDRTFAILQIVAQYPQGIGVTAIADELSLAKSTVSRLLATMQAWSVVEKTADQKFSIGPEPARWVHQQEKSQTLAQRIRPILQSVAKETAEATALCVLDGRELLYQENIPSNQNVQMRDWSGERLPPHTVSPGKLLLAYAGEELIERYLATPLVALTPKTVVDPGILKAQLTVIRNQGFSIADEEFGEGIIGVAVPIFDRSNAIRSEATVSEATVSEATVSGATIDECNRREAIAEYGANEDAIHVVAALCVYGPKFRLDSAGRQMEIIKIAQAALMCN